jgi:hypothetical protein
VQRCLADPGYDVSPNAEASARNASARARATTPSPGRPDSTSNARQEESDQAIAKTEPQRGQRMVGAVPRTGRRSQQFGHTA